MIGVNPYYNAPGMERLDAVCVPSFNNPVEKKVEKFVKDKSQKNWLWFIFPHM